MRNRAPGLFVGITFAVLTLLPLPAGRAQETASDRRAEQHPRQDEVVDVLRPSGDFGAALAGGDRLAQQHGH